MDEMDITQEQKKELIVQALGILGFDENTDNPGMFSKEYENVRCVVDLTAGENIYLYNTVKNCRIEGDDEASTLANIKRIIAEAKEGAMPARSEPDVQYSRDAPKPKPQNPPGAPNSQRALVPKQTDISDLTTGIIQQYICPGATDQEAYMFLKLCQARGLNPFTKEAYLIKYGSAPATQVVGKDAFLRKAEEHSQYNGFEAGIIVRDESGEIVRREGSFVLPDEEILGGWAKVYRKDMKYPFVSEVSFDEYVGKKKDGTVNKQWSSKPATMIRKVPLVQAHREAFTAELSGMYDPVEMGNIDEIDMGEVEVV